MTNTEDGRDEAELTRSEREALRKKLIAARDQIKGTARPSPIANSDVGDEMDEATSTAETEQAYAYDARKRASLAAIERALSKIERGEGYGLSEESGEPIGFRRLEAVPWATLTVAEEEAVERR